jgi:NtrC-family two-component system response regulator AlgB
MAALESLLHFRPRVLVVDDEKNIRTTLSLCLDGMGCEAVAVANSRSALQEVERGPFDLAFVDLRLGKESGLELVPRLLTANANVLIVMITAFADVENAVQAVKRGAWDFLPKPFTPAQIRHLVEKLVEHRDAGWRMAELETQLAALTPEADLSSRSPRMRLVVETALRIALTDATVLLRGENGTGKGVLARSIHAHSPRAARPFVVVHCPVLSDELLVSELFGHARGSFTGAVRDQPGRVEIAEGGTLFLDEIGDISPSLQAKLLRFLQDRAFERIGEQETRHADVRIIAATNRNLEEAVAAGKFREDLLYRLNVLELALAPLRERAEDILPLARRFLAFFGRNAGRHDLDFSRAAEEAMQAYSWPGNVRELRNAVERAVILWPARIVEPGAFPDKIAQAQRRAPVLGGDFTVEGIEREHILRVLGRTGTLEEAAAILGIDSSTLYRKRKRYEQESGA